jgi:hypothetical protein
MTWSFGFRIGSGSHPACVATGDSPLPRRRHLKGAADQKSCWRISKCVAFLLAVSMIGKRKSPLHVFISFKTEERENAHRLKAALNEAGFDVWWQEEIQCGREWHGEIDLALGRAGCVVVLWSRRSMMSPWVRHEASQAVVKGVYAPARLEPMEIDSPYNRTQATDLINWDGKLDHPGFRNLAARVTELMPPNLTLWEKFISMVVRYRTTIGASGFALAAMLLLSWQGKLLVNQSKALTSQTASMRSQRMLIAEQLNKQIEISNDIRRTLNPIRDFSVSAYVEVDSTTPGLAEYIESLKARLPSAILNREHLPTGVHLSRSGPKGVGRNIDFRRFGSFPEQRRSYLALSCFALCRARS